MILESPMSNVHLFHQEKKPCKQHHPQINPGVSIHTPHSSTQAFTQSSRTFLILQHLSFSTCYLLDICPHDWKFLGETQKCYKFFDVKKSWDEALAHCKDAAENEVSHIDLEISFIEIKNSIFFSD